MFTKSPLKNPQSTIRNPQSVPPLNRQKQKRVRPRSFRVLNFQAASVPPHTSPIFTGTFIIQHSTFNICTPPASSTHAGVIGGEALWTTEIKVE